MRTEIAWWLAVFMKNAWNGGLENCRYGSRSKICAVTGNALAGASF